MGEYVSESLGGDVGEKNMDDCDDAGVLAATALMDAEAAVNETNLAGERPPLVSTLCGGLNWQPSRASSSIRGLFGVAVVGEN